LIIAGEPMQGYEKYWNEILQTINAIIGISIIRKSVTPIEDVGLYSRPRRVEVPYSIFQ